MKDNASLVTDAVQATLKTDEPEGYKGVGCRVSEALYAEFRVIVKAQSTNMSNCLKALVTEYVAAYNKALANTGKTLVATNPCAEVMLSAPAENCILLPPEDSSDDATDASTAAEAVVPNLEAEPVTTNTETQEEANSAAELLNIAVTEPTVVTNEGETPVAVETAPAEVKAATPSSELRFPRFDDWSSLLKLPKLDEQPVNS